MNLISFIADNKPLWGVTSPDGSGDVICLSDQFPDWPSLRHVLANQAISTVLQKAKGLKATHKAGTFLYDLPIPDPEKIICVGVNYPDRNAEYKDGQEAPSRPSLFPRFARGFTGHNRPILRPRESEQLDYEGEIAIIIGRGGRRIAQSEALSHIAGLTLCNEGTVRDWTRHAKFNVTQGKNFDQSGSMGPWLVPFEDPSQIQDILLETRVNGQVRQSDRTSRMIFSFAYQIAYISTFTTLVPGDIIITGTPTGAGARFDPPLWLKPGDRVEISADGLGTLSNEVADE